MTKTMIVILTGLCVAGWATAGEHPAKTGTAKETAAKAGLLDGKHFVGELGQKGNEKGDKDEFVFKHGKFLSTACVAYGFTEAPYVAMKDGGAITFTSEPTNDKAEKMSWKGTVKNGTIEGTVVHQTKEGTTAYWFKGTMKAAGEHPKKAEHSEHPN